MTRIQRQERFFQRHLNGLRPIPKKLWLQKIVTSIRVTVGAVTFATVVFASYYAWTAWMTRQKVVSSASLRRVEADVEDFNVLTQRWTKNKVADVSRLPFVNFGYPRKEVSVQVTIDGKLRQDVSMEGLVGREPEFLGPNLAWGKSVARGSTATVILPHGLFERLGGRLTDGGPIPEALSVIVSRMLDDSTQTQRIEMRIAGLLRRESDKIYAPLDLAINLDRFQTHKSESPLGDSARELESMVVYDHVDAYVPPRFEKNVREEELAFAIRAERISFVEVLEATGALRATFAPKKGHSSISQAEADTVLGAVHHEFSPGWLLNDDLSKEHQVHLGPSAADPRWSLAQPGSAPETGGLAADPPSTALLPQIKFSDVHALLLARRRFELAGVCLKPLVELNRLQLIKFAVRSTSADGSVSSSKARQLVMAQPTFSTVVPRILLGARIGNVDVMIKSTVANDPLWFESVLIAGSPKAVIAESTGICLTREIARRVFPNLAADELLGRMAKVILSCKEKGSVQDRHISQMMKVVGVVDSDNCMVSLETMKTWRLWRDKNLVYDAARMKFRKPGAVYRERGFITAVFYASSDGAVRPLVEHLESLGCKVTHQLEQQHRLAQLAIAVATLVILFVSGTILNAAANSGAIAWMDLSTKFKEIGVKMAYGVTRTDIAFAYLAEAFLVGLLACFSGMLLVLSTDTLLRNLIQQTIGLGPDFFIIPINSFKVGWLYGVAALVVVGFNLIGTLLPTWLAVRKSPIDLMK